MSGSINERFAPWGTVVVNTLGSLVLGFIAGRWGLGSDSAARLGVTVGLLGGFTTFSTFALDVVRLWEEGTAALSVLVVAASVGLGVAAALAGMVAGRV